MKIYKLSESLSVLALAALAHSQAQAQFVPIPLSEDSYAFDVIVEKEAPHPFIPATTASMDGGTNNTGYTYYEMGYNLEVIDSGIPAAGSTVTSETLADHTFTFAPSYTNNNALLIDGSLTNGTLTLSTPAAYSSLSFLAAAGNSATVLNYTLHFAGGTSETGTFSIPDWFNDPSTAVTANGRVLAASGGFGEVGSGNPRLYSVDIAVTNATAAISSIDLSFGSGGATAHAAVFGVSGSTGADFTPVLVTGFNQDMVVEAGASRAAALEVTSASLDAGTGNTGYSFYERGYNLTATNSGVPLAGTLVTNVSAADHVYRMAASYVATNNAALVDEINPSATLTFVTSASYSALSILGSSGGGAVTVDYTITHSDASTQIGNIIVPDWFNVAPFALALGGRVQVENGGFDAVGSENPRLYSIDIAVEKTTVPITSVALQFNVGGGHAAIFALSGAGGAVRPIFDTQPATFNALVGTSGQLTAAISGTAPITFQWQQEIGGVFTNVIDSSTVTGATTTNLSFTSLSLTNAGNYVIIASNLAGSSTSLVTRVNVLSDQPDVTAPGDTIVILGGSAPANEPVENAIDNTTTKYLNFGDGDAAAPFAGPVGLVITPAMGSTIVTGLRIYTANDAVERDPADYTLDGSNDEGATFTPVAAGTLALPAGRNAAGLELDPLTLVNQEVTFSNGAGYTTYRLTFTNVKDNAIANSVQIGEIELLGTAGTGNQGPLLSISRNASDVTLSWTGTGTLQATPSLTNIQWADVPGTSPVTQPITGSQRFFRVISQ